MSELLELRIEVKEIPVRLVDSSGSHTNWTLRELLGHERNKYLNQMTSRVKIGKNGKSLGIKSFDGFQTDLLIRCLRDDKGDPIEKDVLENLPASTQTTLFEKAQELSGLTQDEDEDDEEKND